MNKAVITGVSLILLVGVVIGIVATVNNQGGSKTASSSDLATGSKAVDDLCGIVDFKDACKSALSPIATSNSSITTHDLIKSIFDLAAKEFQKAIDKPGSLTTDKPMEKMALDDCKRMFEYAVIELQDAVSSIGDAALHSKDSRLDDLTNWLAAAAAHREACLDGLEEPELKTAITNGLVNATQMSTNALAIVHEISNVITSLTTATKSTNSRRLLQSELDHEGLPTWFSAADRKLMRKGGAGAGMVRVPPNAIVAQDGSGQFKTITAALAAYPKNLRGRYVIYIKAGVYHEYVHVEKSMRNVFMYGDGPKKTIVTGSKSYVGGYKTMDTATFSIDGPGFMAKSMAFTNTAGPENHQAVALRSDSDKAVFFNCRFDGYQDTLYVHANRQFFRNCVISGTVDFIFGYGKTYIQNSLIIVRKPMDGQSNTVTADGTTDPRRDTGTIIHNCRIVPEQKLFPYRFKIPTYLGRPWQKYAKTVIMESTLGDFINPAGWLPWSGNFALDTLYYAEYGNRGPGANTSKRVKWSGYHVINRNTALKFTAGPFLQGPTHPDTAAAFLKASGVPFLLGLKR